MTVPGKTFLMHARVNSTYSIFLLQFKDLCVRFLFSCSSSSSTGFCSTVMHFPVKALRKQAESIISSLLLGSSSLNQTGTVRIPSSLVTAYIGHSRVLETFHVRKLKTESCTFIHLEACNQICKDL
ncbi:hypothetical protein ATANTOWER_018262 [Ataeniobius toweri]|uniref:Uncharacterized protein n=1 Tax=Ataeniobius toweri TaxID=208326 RepID=A0ABU7A707_9TELE|nr:hypothetical protein [Ataeniobius toweri]